MVIGLVVEHAEAQVSLWINIATLTKARRLGGDIPTFLMRIRENAQSSVAGNSEIESARMEICGKASRAWRRLVVLRSLWPPGWKVHRPAALRIRLPSPPPAQPGGPDSCPDRLIVLLFFVGGESLTPGVM